MNFEIKAIKERLVFTPFKSSSCDYVRSPEQQTSEEGNN